MAFNWTCPYCNRDQSVAENMYSSQTHFIGVKTSKYVSLFINHSSIACANKMCNNIVVNVSVGKNVGDFESRVDLKDPLFSRRILPQGSAKPQPEYIPKSITDDYYEACLIKDLSPKAAATLARRCLQGMIRDFCGITKKRLIDEVDELREHVKSGKADRSISPETVEAIDHVRKIGNIGAHMETDINIIIPVEAEEADILINLLEMLFDEWYVARNKRHETLNKISIMAQEKMQAKLLPPLKE